MNDTAHHAPSSPKKKPLDTVVKLAMTVFFGSFALIWGGMYLSRPDRSIPPYSIGSQEGTAVAVHVPAWTSDPEIETLIERFRKVGRETRNFGPMKIRPTTPADSSGRYQRITIYIFTHDAWAEAPILHKFLTGEDQEVRDGFKRALRGFYQLTETEEEGRIGPLVDGPDSAATSAFSRRLFKEAAARRPSEPNEQRLPP
jgi:hypothetical protein